MKKADIIIIAVLFAAAAVLYGIFGLTAKKGAYAEVLVEGRPVKTLPLDTDAVYIPEGKNLRIEVKDGRVAVTESDCPDKICVNTGFVSGRGRTIVCVPERVAVVLSGEGEADVVA